MVSSGFSDFYLTNRELSRPRTYAEVVRSVSLRKVVISIYFYELWFDRYEFLINDDRHFVDFSSSQNRMRFGGVVELEALDFLAYVW